MAKSITVADETLENIEAALDHLTFRVKRYGCIEMSGAVPPELSECLDRALLRVEEDAVIQGHDRSATLTGIRCGSYSFGSEGST